MKIIILLTAFIAISTQQIQAEAQETQKNCTSSGVPDAECNQQCEPNHFSKSGGPCQLCSVCVDRLLASACTPTNDTVCGSCAPRYFEAGGRCLKCSLEPDNLSCATTDTNTSPRFVTVPSVPGGALGGAESTTSLSTHPQMGLPVIYVALCLVLVLLGLAAIVLCVVFCPKKEYAAAGQKCDGEDNAGHNDRNDIPLVPLVPDPPGQAEPDPAIPLLVREDGQLQQPIPLMESVNEQQLNAEPRPAEPESAIPSLNSGNGQLNDNSQPRDGGVPISGEPLLGAVGGSERSQAPGQHSGDDDPAGQSGSVPVTSGGNDSPAGQPVPVTSPVYVHQVQNLTIHVGGAPTATGLQQVSPTAQPQHQPTQMSTDEASVDDYGTYVHEGYNPTPRGQQDISPGPAQPLQSWE